MVNFPLRAKYGVKKCAKFIWDQNSPLQIRRSHAKTHCEKFYACKSVLTIHGEVILNALILYGSFLTSFHLVLGLVLCCVWPVWPEWCLFGLRSVSLALGAPIWHEERQFGLQGARLV